MDSEGNKVPLIVMLTASVAICTACIVYKVTLFHTLLFVFLTMLSFYGIGQILRKVILKINRDAEERAALIERENQEAEAEAGEGEEENGESAGSEDGDVVIAEEV